MNFSIFKKSIFKETIVYTATDIIGKAMSFILLPFVSYYVSPSELGIVTNFAVIAQLILLFAGMAMVNSLPYFFYEQDRAENNLLVSNLLMLCVTLCGILTIVIFFSHQYVYDYLQLDLGTQLLSICFVLGNLVSQTNLVLLRLENRSKHFAYLQIVQIMFHTLLVVLFVVILRGGGLGKIYAEVIVFSLIGLLHLFILHRKGYLKAQFEMRWFKTLLKFGIPLLPHSLSFWFKGGMDKVFITTYCGLQFNGLYSMALSISSIFTMLVNSFFSAYTPYLQKLLSQGQQDMKHKIVKQTYLLCIMFFFIALLALVGSWFIFEYIIDNSYRAAFNYMPFIILANYIYLIYNFTIQYIYKMKKTCVMGIITFCGSVIQMFLSYMLVQIYGVMGAVYSFLIGNVIISIGIAAYSYFVFPMPWLDFQKIFSKQNNGA